LDFARKVRAIETPLILQGRRAGGTHAARGGGPVRRPLGKADRV
jgi:hypothetical protein